MITLDILKETDLSDSQKRFIVGAVWFNEAANLTQLKRRLTREINQITAELEWINRPLSNGHIPSLYLGEPRQPIVINYERELITYKSILKRLNK